MKRGTKNITALLSLIVAIQFCIQSAISQAPNKISYQAAIRNASDLLIVSQPIGMRISVLQGSASGTVVFSETHVATTTPNGIVSIVIGGGTLVSGNISTIDWEDGPYFIQTETDPLGGTTYTISGTTELISVPYAFYSPTAGNIFSGDYNDLTNKPATDGSETKINGGTFVTVTGSGTIASPYVINSNPVMGGFSHYLGELYDGGIIFHLYKRADGTEHALIVSLTESPGTLTLQNPISNTNAESFWDGLGNSAKYTNSQAVTWATGLGYGWYLPAVDELSYLWQNRYHANKGLAAAGGAQLTNDWHWSSSETEDPSNNLGWQFSFLTGAARSSQAKGSFGMVRAVRGMTTAPTQLTTTAVTDVTNVAATTGGTLLSDEGSPVTARGVCWSSSPNPTTADNITTDGSGIGTWTSSITGLTINNTYYVRAWATNGRGTAYGNELSFTTAATAPVVTTTAASSLTQISASSGGNVTDDRGSAVTARGICWSTSTNPTLADNVTSDGMGTGVFTSPIAGLTAGTVYYVRAYATNGVGTTYGNEINFKTLNVPAVTTSATAYTGGGNGTSGGEVTDEGGVSVTARGVCWNTTGSPTVSDSHTTDGSGLGTFSSALTGLTIATTYYVRAYATSSEGTTYGTEETFFSLALGDSYAGGVVAFLDGTGQHGLIASSADLANAQWSNVNFSNAGASSVVNGTNNTALIIAQAGHTGSAALNCRNYNGGGFTDWYLPARDEMATLNTNRTYIPSFAGDYWTSSEQNTPPYQFSTRYRIGTGTNNISKLTIQKVRAIRQF